MDPKKAETSSHQSRAVSFPRRLSHDSAEAINAVESVHQFATLQLIGMAQWATDRECHDCLRSIAARVDDLFRTLTEEARSGQLRPLFHIGLAERDQPVLMESAPVRVGFYPVAANPLHWGHILVALSAMVQRKLDKIVFVVAGRDRRKPSMTSEETRHRLGRSVIESFRPLFAYSSLALGTDFDGETNLGRLLRLNSRQPMEVSYIAGGDHCRRASPDGEPDTIEKLERVVRENGNPRHRITAVFVNREGSPQAPQSVETFLDVHILPQIPFSFSSTAARKALCEDAFCVALVSLPYSCLLEIRTGGMYAGKADCTEELDRPF